LALFLPEPVSEESMARLQLLVDHSDGFILAEKELDQRGAGNVGQGSHQQSGKHRGVFWVG
jgi:ATP-dependent DNA helicase RecG